MDDLIRRSDAIEAIEEVDWYHQNRNKDMVSGANSSEHQAWYKADDVYKALEAIPSADRPQEWIPCSEKEPNEFIDVLVCLTDGTMDVVQLTDYVDIDGEPKWCHSTDYTLGGAILNSDVVAWMPLPKPWKGADDE